MLLVDSGRFLLLIYAIFSKVVETNAIESDMKKLGGGGERLCNYTHQANC